MVSLKKKKNRAGVFTARFIRPVLPWYRKPQTKKKKKKN